MFINGVMGSVLKCQKVSHLKIITPSSSHSGQVCWSREYLATSCEREARVFSTGGRLVAQLVSYYYHYFYLFSFKTGVLLLVAQLVFFVQLTSDVLDVTHTIAGQRL